MSGSSRSPVLDRPPGTRSDTQLEPQLDRSSLLKLARFDRSEPPHPTQRRPTVRRIGSPPLRRLIREYAAPLCAAGIRNPSQKQPVAFGSPKKLPSISPSTRTPQQPPVRCAKGRRGLSYVCWIVRTLPSRVQSRPFRGRAAESRPIKPLPDLATSSHLRHWRDDRG